LNRPSESPEGRREERPEERPQSWNGPVDPVLSFPAMLYDGVSPRPRSATAIVESDRLTLLIDGVQGGLDIRPEHIAGESRVRGEVHLEIRSPSDAPSGGFPSLKLVVNDAAFGRALARYLSRSDVRTGAAFRRAVGRIPYWGWLAMAVVVAPAMYFALTQGFVALHGLVSVEEEVALGDAVYQHLLRTFKVCEDAGVQNELQAMVDELAEPHSPYQIRVSVFDAKHMNALALPGGRIVIFAGLLKDSSPEGVMGVLAHEVAHVECRHTLKQILRAMGVAFFMSSMIAGGIEELELAETASEVAGTLVVLKYSRSSEAEADEIAVRKLHEDRRSVAGFIDFFERVDRKHGLGGAEKALLWLSSHPLTARRIAALRSARAGERFEPVPWRMAQEKWNELVRRCPGENDPQGKAAREEALEDPPNERREKR